MTSDTKSEALHRSIAQAFARVEEVVEEHSAVGKNTRQPRIVELLFNPEQRNELIFMDSLDDAGLDPEDWDANFAEFNLVPEHSRDILYRATMEALLAAAIAQTDTELFLPDLWEALEKGSKGMLTQSDKMNESDLQAASFGPGKLLFVEEKKFREERKKLAKVEEEIGEQIPPHPE
jgi:hypothetical protein